MASINIYPPGILIENVEHMYGMFLRNLVFDQELRWDISNKFAYVMFKDSYDCTKESYCKPFYNVLLWNDTLTY